MGTSGREPWFRAALFDQLPNVVFFTKDAAGRYRLVNETLVSRLGLSSKAELIGRTTRDVFPGALGERFAQQDREVLEHGVTVRDLLEVHPYPGGRSGWCVTHKVPLLDERGVATGLAGLSRDVHEPDASRDVYERLARVVEYLGGHYDQPVRVPDLAAMAQMSVAKLERIVRRVFHTTPTGLLRRRRLDAAMRLLVRPEPSISEVAQRCGFTDHSAFTRQFRMRIGMTPSQYRANHGVRSGQSPFELLE